MKLDVSTKEGYDIAAGLVGPHIPQLQHLKWLITGEIRRAMGVASSITYEDTCMVRDEKITPERIRGIKGDIQWLSSAVHERCHIQRVVTSWLLCAHAAICALGTPKSEWLPYFTMVVANAVREPTAHYWGLAYHLLDGLNEPKSRLKSAKTTLERFVASFDNADLKYKLSKGNSTITVQFQQGGVVFGFDSAEEFTTFDYVDTKENSRADLRDTTTDTLLCQLTIDETLKEAVEELQRRGYQVNITPGTLGRAQTIHVVQKEQET